MAKIKKTEVYNYDTSISPQDYLLGTDQDNNKRTKSYKIEDLIAFISTQANDIAQNNVIREINLGDLGATISTETKEEAVANAINALAPYEILDTQVVLYYAEMYPDRFKQKLVYAALLKGKGTYGVGGIQILAGDLFLVNPLQVATERNTTVINNYLNENKILSGSIIWISDLTFLATDIEYIIDGELYTSPRQVITLSAADPTNPRIDTFVVTTNSTLLVLEGTPSPSPSEEVPDFQTQLRVTIAIISAAQTEPDNVDTLQIYNENVGEPNEWVATENTSGARIVVNSTNDSQSGTISAEFTNLNQTDVFTLSKTATVDFLLYSHFVFNIKLDGPWSAQGKFAIDVKNTGGNDQFYVTIQNATYDFDTQNTTGWQTVVVPLDDFQITNYNIDEINFRFKTSLGTISPFYIDNVRLVEGVENIVNDLNRDPQTLSWTNPNLSISKGNTVNLSDLAIPNTVDSVNTQTGVVVLDADDIDDSATAHKFVTAADLTNLSNLSGTNTGDQDISGKADKINVLELDNTAPFTPDADYEPATKKYVDDAIVGGGGYTDEQAQDAVGTILTDSPEIDFNYDDVGNQITASIVTASIDETKLDVSTNASLDLADSAVQPTDSVTTLSDVTNAGSGAIITTPERDKLNNIEANAKDDQIASEVPFTPTGNTTSTDVQAAIVELQGDIDAFVDTDNQNANEVPYTNTTSGLTATDVQAALDEIEARVDLNDAKVSDVNHNVDTNLSVGTITGTTLDVNSSDGTNATLPSATITEAGLMSAADKTALDAISDTDDQIASEVPVTPAGNLTSTDVQAALQELQGDIDGLPGGHDAVTLNVDTTTQETLNLTTQELQVNKATASTDGAMSAEDKAKLDGIETSATALPVIDTTAIVKGSVDATKLVRIEADGLTTATTRTITMPDADVDLGDIATNNAKVSNVSTNLSYTPSTRIVASSDGTDATLPEVIAAGDSGLMTGADKTKLDGIEVAADVTDATNVDAAGAVMESDISASPSGRIIDDDTMVSASATTLATSESIKSYVDGRVASSVNYQGGYNAATNTPDLDVAPSGVLTGYMYTVTVPGTFFATLLETGDVLISEIDNPTVETDWTVVQKDMDAASIKTSYESNANTNAFTDAEQTKLGTVETNAKDDQIASEVPYTNTTSGLTATDVQAAIDEIDATIDGLPAAHSAVTLDVDLDTTQQAANLVGQELELLKATVSTDGVMSSEDKTKLDGIATGAEVNAVDSVNAQTGAVVLDTGDVSSILDNRYVTDAQLVVIANTSGTNTGDQNAAQVVNTPSGNLIATDVQGALNELQGDIDGLAIPTQLVDLDTTVTGAQLNTIKTTVDGLATVSTSGDYSDLINKPTATITANTGTTVDVSNVLGNICNDAAPNAATTYTVSATIPNGYARVRINVATEPVVSSATKEAGSLFVPSQDMYLNIYSAPSGVKYYFTAITQPIGITKTSDLTNDGSDATSTYVENDEIATVATSGQLVDLDTTVTGPELDNIKTTVDGIGSATANLIIEGVGGTITTPALLAAQFTFAEADVVTFVLDGTTVIATISNLSYNIGTGFANNGQGVITAIREKSGYLKQTVSQTFLNCTSLAVFDCVGVELIADSTFSGCSALLPENINFNPIVQVGSNAFANMGNTVGYIWRFPNLTTISGGAFQSKDLILDLPKWRDGSAAIFTSFRGVINAPNLRTLGNAATDQGVFTGIDDGLVEITVHSDLRTANSGFIDASLATARTLNADINYAQKSESVELTPVLTGAAVTIDHTNWYGIVTTLNNAAAVITINTASLDDVGDMGYVKYDGTGTCTFSAGTATVTVNANQTLAMDGQYSLASVMKTGANTYHVTGQLIPV